MEKKLVEILQDLQSHQHSLIFPQDMKMWSSAGHNLPTYRVHKIIIIITDKEVRHDYKSGWLK